MRKEEADDIVDKWHDGFYPPLWSLEDVFKGYGWSHRDFDHWVRTGETPDEQSK